MTKNKIYSLALVFLIIDQLSKLLIETYLGERLMIIKNFFYLDYHRNSGAAFGLFQNSRFFLIVITVVVLVALSKIIVKELSITKLMGLTYALLIGGIFGNFFDRIFRTYVIDFLSFRIFSRTMPIFNLADAFIVVGALLLLIFNFKEMFDEYQSRKRKTKNWSVS